MKKLRSLFVALLLFAIAFPALAETTTTEEMPVDVEVTEKMFLAQISDINLNSEDYLGKVIALEGMFMTVDYGTGGPVYHLVYRKSPGCCGNDGITGLEVVWDDPATAFPAENTWVRAVGTLEQYTEEDMPYLQLSLQSLTPTDKPGLDSVTQ